MSLVDFNASICPLRSCEAIREAGFVTTTPIQEAALPLALKGKDVAGQSQTGTGKTAAFLIAAFTRLLRQPAPAAVRRRPAPRVLIIAPTRELVVQIESDARQLGRFTPFNIQAVYGGIDYAKQRETLAAGCDLLVGTPGRLIDYLKQHVWSPRKVEVLVIDEADRMFDMGFIADLRFILRRLPAARAAAVVPVLGHAVLPGAGADVGVHEQSRADHDHAPADDGRAGRAAALPRRPRGEVRPAARPAAPRGRDRILIFANTREEARRLEERLTRNGWEARALTGDVDQKRRLRILNDFKEGQLPVLVATDVASRGLHIEAVTHVVNWDLPQDPEDYVHRIGRTARAGAAGKAISLVDEASALEPRGDREVHRAEDPRGVGRRTT